MLSRLFRHFENLVQPTAPVPETAPPQSLLGFFHYFLDQMPGLLVRLFAGGFIVAVLDTTIPIFIGRVTGLLTTHKPATLLSDTWPQFLLMAAVVFLVRPAAWLLQVLTINQAVGPGMANLIRWQSHWHVVRQSWSFFQSDFAGRIANRVMQTGPSLREALVMGADAAWYILVYGTSAMAVLLTIDAVLITPIILWFIAYGLLLRTFVPRLRQRSLAVSEVRSLLTGRVVDAYTNILTVKLFARAQDEDDFVREALDDHTTAYQAQTRMMSGWVMCLALLNATLLGSMTALAIGLWTQGRIPLAAMATALTLAWQLTNMAGWVGRSVTGIFENLGLVQDGMRSIAVPRTHPDAPGAGLLHVEGGGIIFERLSFGYGSERGVLHGIDVRIAPGERVGLVGPSGAGKSTLVNLLLGFHRPESGRILIDGQDIAGVTQESLRSRIAMVTQDTSLLHRSIRDNIRYGRPGATDAQVARAADQARLTTTIAALPQGANTVVGERGVKLSGGQKQRLAIARLFLRDPAILILDEATSALDTETERAIQDAICPAVVPPSSSPTAWPLSVARTVSSCLITAGSWNRVPTPNSWPGTVSIAACTPPSSPPPHSPAGRSRP